MQAKQEHFSLRQFAVVRDCLVLPVMSCWLLTKFADLLGLAFQITDDILDVEGDAAQMGKAAHSDEKKHKSTYVTLYTLEGAKALAQKTVDEALGCLEMFGENAEALREITKMMCGRKS